MLFIESRYLVVDVLIDQLELFLYFRQKTGLADLAKLQDQICHLRQLLLVLEDLLCVEFDDLGEGQLVYAQFLQW